MAREEVVVFVVAVACILAGIAIISTAVAVENIYSPPDRIRCPSCGVVISIEDDIPRTETDARVGDDRDNPDE